MAVVVAACARPVEGATIDGWTLGPVDSCPIPNLARGVPRPERWDCQLGLTQWVAAATEGFDGRDPGHATIFRTTIHTYGGLATRSGGCCMVAVFELVDGSVRAIGVGHPGIDTEHLITVDYGP